MNIKIIEAKNDKDCEICDKFLSKLINFEGKLDNAINQNAKIKNLHKNSLKNDYVYIAYAVKEKPIGYIFGYLKNGKGEISTTNVLNIEAIFVDEEERKNKVGKLLLKSFEDWAERNFEKDYAIEITTINTNTNAFEFYQHMGYKPVKTILRK